MDESEIRLTLADPSSGGVARPRWVTVAVSGEIDVATAADVLATLLAASESETAGIVVDVSAVTFFSAAAVGAFIGARNHEREHGRDLVLRGPPRVVRQVLAVCSLADLVEPPATDKPTSVPGAAPPSWRQMPAALDGSDR